MAVKMHFKVLLCEITWRNCSISKRAKMLMFQVKDLNAGLRAQPRSLRLPLPVPWGTGPRGLPGRGYVTHNRTGRPHLP